MGSTVEILGAAGLAFARTLDLDSVLEGLLDCLAQLVPYDSANVMLVEGEARLSLRVLRGYERWGDPARTRTIAFDTRTNPVLKAVLTTRKSVLIPDTRQHPGWERIPGTEHVLCWLGVPLSAGGSIVGLYSLDKAEAGFFTEEHRGLAESLAPHAALAIQNARLYARERAAREESERLQAATRAVSATLDPQQVFTSILSELRALVPCDSASVMELKGERMEIVGGHGFANLADLLGVSFDVTADNPNREVVRSRAPVLIDDVPARYPAFGSGPHAATPIHSWLGVPLLFGDRLIGMLTLDKAQPGFFTTEHARLAESFASHAAVALENARLYASARRELSERKRAEAAILAEKAFSEAMLNSLPGIFFLFDQTGRALRWNPSLEAVSGYSAGEIAAMRPLDFFGEEDRPGFEKTMAEVFETGASHAEAPLLSKDGRQTPHYFVCERVEVDGVPCCLGMGIDITARKRLEAQLLEAQKLEAVGRLAGGVAHEFNNILGVITGYSELAQRQLGPEHPARARVDEVLKAAERAASLTRQLLAFGHKQVMRPRLLDLNGLVAGAQRMLDRLIGEDVDVVFRPAPGLGTVKADPAQLEQTILNLAVNARDAMPKGGSLTLETANVDLGEDDAAAHPPAKPGRYVTLAVSDTGIGMDEETQRRIFEPFFSTKPVGKGTGLGLATVHGIVEQSGGFIQVSSEPGRGTTFKVYLVRVDEPKQAAPAGAAPAEAPRGHETILLVEDTEMLREVIRETLEGLGHTVLLASNGEEALALARQREGPIDLLLTDVVMPKLGGGELAKLLSALRPGIRVVYMSGNTNGTISHHGVLGEDTLLLEKPFTGDKLARAVREALDRPAPRG